MSSVNEDFADRYTPEEILNKLKTALLSEGDFPVRAQVVNELRLLTNNPKSSVAQVTEVILREPSLATRVLHVVNSAFYQRARPIMTVTQAVLHVGMRPLSELCASLVLMQRFIPQAQRGGIFADSLKKSILSALITSYFAREQGEAGSSERGYLAGTFFNLGYLLLAYYFPQIYEAAGVRAKSRGHDITQSVTEILGIDPVDLSLATVDTLEIPEYYRDVLLEAHKSFEERELTGPNHALANALSTADLIASTIICRNSKEELLAVLEELSEVSGYALPRLLKMIDELPGIFREHCRMIEMSFLTLPDYVLTFSDEDEKDEEQDISHEALSDDFSRYTEEIKTAIADREPISSVITSVMETLAFHLKFERVLLLLADSTRSELVGRMALGSKVKFNPKDIRRKIEDLDEEYAPDAAAYMQGVPVIFGDPILEDGWPMAVIPIGGNINKPIGVIYADKVETEDDEGEELNSGVQASLSILSDLLDQAITANEN